MGITRMTRTALGALENTGRVAVNPVSSRSSIQWGCGDAGTLRIPWSTRSKPLRLLGDHLHPWLAPSRVRQGVWYYPKGFLPLCGPEGRRTVVTVHDVILQHCQDHYPEWRSGMDYRYWLGVLANTLRRADRILTVSNAAKAQIEAFMNRRGLPCREMTITHEPCAYEPVEQPDHPAKDGYVLHLASREPHKGTGRLICWWIEHTEAGMELPVLRVVGALPEAVRRAVEDTPAVMAMPFMADADLQACYKGARALVFPSEIEGFVLPALEAYYLVTPVCYVRGTAVEEILSVATAKGGFSLDQPESLLAALDEVMSMPPGEVRACGLKLRETYAAAKVAERMLKVFEELGR